MGIGRKTNLPGSVPSVFEFKPEEKKKERKPPKPRNNQETSSEFETESESSDSQCFVDASNSLFGFPEDIDNISKLLAESLRCKIEHFELENKKLMEENIKLKSHIYNFENVSESGDEFCAATGLTVESFNNLPEFLNPGKDSCNIKFYDTSSRLSQSCDGIGSPKSGPKLKLSSQDQLIMYMTWLKNGFAHSHLAWLFKISKSTVTRYLITWTNFCYFSLGAIPIWPSREVIDSTMPQSFKNTYPSTRCIIDCTGLFCQKPSSLNTQSCMYSHYKSHVTYKGLLGIAPSGGITFISQLYDGSISDKEIVRRSGISDERFWQPNDSVMADRGFTIDEKLKQLKVDLNIPAFLGGRSQLTKAEIKKSQTIASVRIHVERAISRIKKF